MLPLVRGLYLAERVEVDPVSRNLTLVNCFRGLRMRQLPGVVQPFSVVAYLANGVGAFEVLVRIDRMDTFAEVFRARTRLNLPDRLTEVRFVLQLAGCVLSATGEYSVSLWLDDELLAQTPFNVRVALEAQ